MIKFKGVSLKCNFKIPKLTFQFAYLKIFLKLYILKNMF